jgi:hypothetical protein
LLLKLPDIELAIDVGLRVAIKFRKYRYLEAPAPPEHHGGTSFGAQGLVV